MHAETQPRDPSATPDVEETSVAEAEEAAPKSRSLAPLRMVFRTALQYPRQIAYALTALVVTSLATLAIPYRFKVIVDEGFSGASSASDIGHAFQYLLMIVVVLGIGTAFRFYFVSWLGERVVADIRLRVQENLLRLSPGFYEVNSPKEISSRMTSDTAVIENVVGTTVSVALRNTLTGIGGIAMLFYLAPTLTLGLLVAIPLVVVPIVVFGRRIRAVSRSSQDRIADVGAYVTEVLSAMKIVQSFGQERRESERFAGVVENTFDTAKRRILLRAVMTSVVIVLIFGAMTLVMWRGALAVAAGEITGGTIAAFVLVGGLVAGAFGALTEVYGDLLRGAGAASRLAELLEARPDIAPPARPERLPEPARGSLSFRNVTFRYPARPETAALRDFTLEIEPGETVAIVGPSGAGKSTIFQLVERFYDPQGGTIRL
ncbi:MAG: ABC transporter transmembrane domain-containing protein, partial [Erythrobacter sp.]